MSADLPREKGTDADCESVPRTGSVNDDDPAELARWAKAFGISEKLLLQAIRIVGNAVADLRRLFCRD
jgi:hypothetical protein